MSLSGALLGFLAREPATGYTLKQRFDGAFWTVTQSQVYRELHTLEEEALVESKLQAGGPRPDRRVYVITRSGRAALKAWLAEPIEGFELRDPLLIKLEFAVDLDELQAVLLRHQATLQELRERRQARLATSKRERNLSRLVVEHTLAFYDFELDFIERALKRLRNK